MKTKKAVPTTPLNTPATPKPTAAAVAPPTAVSLPAAVSPPPTMPAPLSVIPQVPQVPFQYPPTFNPYMINPMAAYLQGFNMPTMGMPMPGMPMPGMMPGMPMPGMPMPGMPMPGMPMTTATPGMPWGVPLSPCKERSSSPITGIAGGVHDFCEAYGISENEELALDKLGFEIGDDLGQVTEQQYEAVGFKALAWLRVLKAYRKFK
jgi:hypothetical protein